MGSSDGAGARCFDCGKKLSPTGKKGDSRSRCEPCSRKLLAPITVYDRDARKGSLPANLRALVDKTI
jgi:hypothetical protein